ncbi:hypothetical protein Tco_1067694 [Tanacetum coccineum]|uniref:Uncharacterized protein n=1 Tax=Tanacetum coccineum TaxID=301880 RepID=A0ABQ5HFA1_9ASTR
MKCGNVLIKPGARSMISLKAQGIKALIPSALVSEGPRSKGLMAAILLYAGAIKLAARTSSRDEDPGSEVTLGGRIIPFTCETAKKNSFSLNPPLTLFRVGLTRKSKQSPQPRKRTPG